MTRVAVIGAGVMGRNHARVYRKLDDVDLVGIADLDANLATEAASQLGCPNFRSAAELLDLAKAEAVSVTVPTRDHRDVAMEAIRRGVHVLVEKPIAQSVAEGEEMARAAEEAGVILAVGHVERYNPAVVELKRRLQRGDLGEVFKIQARRVGPFPGRVDDVGVVIDLATHDVDIMRFLLEREVESAYAEIGGFRHRVHEDLLTGVLRFEGGVVGALDVNWLSPNKVRELSVTGENGVLIADYLTQELYHHRPPETEERRDGSQNVQDVEEEHVVRIGIAREEPLRAELAAFVDAVRAGGPGAIVPAKEGIAALEAAQLLLEAGRRRAVVTRAELAGERRSPPPAQG